MKYKVGDKVRIDYPGHLYDGEIVQIVGCNSSECILNLNGVQIWMPRERLVGAHEDCGCSDLGEPHSPDAGITGAVSLRNGRPGSFTKIKVDDKREKIAEVIKWLYINDRKFDSGKGWREKFVEFLEEIL